MRINWPKMVLMLLYALVVNLAFFVLWHSTAHAHMAHEGTSDGPDVGRSIELYKAPGTMFEGRFMRSREQYNRIPGVPNFRMVYSLERAEVFVYAYTDTQCRGRMTKSSMAIDTIMITTACHGRILETVAEHELGHGLDLEHHDCDDYTSIMNMCARVDHLTFHDRLTLKAHFAY